MRIERRGLRCLVLIAGALVLTAVLAAWLHFEVGGARTALWVDDVATALAALLATVLCVRAAVLHHGSVRLFWVLLAGAAGAWTVAEAIWGVYDLLLDGVPTVSWADAGYLAAIPLAAAALLVHPALRGRPGTRKARAVLDGLTVATALLFLSWTIVLGPLWDTSDLSTLGGAVAFAYPFGDVVLMFFVVLAVRRMTGADRLSLACLLGGLLAMAFADSWYAYRTGVEDFESGGLLDAGWFLAYLGIALSALIADGERSEVRDAAPVVPAVAGDPLAPVVVPFVPVIAALVVLGAESQLGDRPDAVGTVSALALVALVLVRQVLLLRDMRAERDPDRDADARVEGARS
jgi:hypothetical protein